MAAAAFQALGVCVELADACAALGWKAPTEIQAQAIPLALAGKDVIGLAQTGSGKTGAFALPILQALLDKPQPFFALVLSPTRELAVQISSQFEALGSAVGVRTATLVGGVDTMAQAVALAKRPHVIVGTPGRVMDHLTNTKAHLDGCTQGFSLRQLQHLVLDEADRILSLDFEEEIDKILKVIPRERCTQLYSATMTTKVQKLQRACLRNPVKVEVASKYQTVSTLRQEYLFLPAKHKDCYAVYVLTELAGCTSMIFTRTCDASRRLALLLRVLGFDAVPIHGNMSQPKRLGALNKFKAGERSILVATDVASRGLDIPSVDFVLNYDVPANSKDYVHRYDVELYQRIEKLIGKQLEPFPAEEAAVLLLVERVGEAQRVAALQIREADSKQSKRGGGKRARADDGDEDTGKRRGGAGRK